MTDSSVWADAVLSAHLFAIDPSGTGAVLHGAPGIVRDRWLALVEALLPKPAPLRRVPLHVADGRLLGGLDLAATLRAGRPIEERGLLAQADGGVILLPMAERFAPATAGRIAATLDSGAVSVERDGLARAQSARIGVVALDEGIAEEEQLPEVLSDRLAFRIDLNACAAAGATNLPMAVHILDARAAMPSVAVGESIVPALCRAAHSLGIPSIRVALLALRVARIHAALFGRAVVTDIDAAVAGRLVLAPRATALPTPPPEEEDPPAENDGASDSGARTDTDSDGGGDSIGDLVVAAATAAIPPGLLARLAVENAVRRGAGSSGRTGAMRGTVRRGRPIGSRRGELRDGARLHVLETLRAAAPWQRLRRREAGAIDPRDRPRIEVRREDFRITRFKQPTETTTVFAVDASGSSALHRLAEAKGAVEMLLAECYVRRDRVALIAFRGRGAETLLPPTRSLARAKRGLADLAGGGGTPLCAGIDAAGALAESARRQGRMPVVVLLTDGRANVARDGTSDRAQADADALDAGRRLRATGIAAILVDTAPRPAAAARTLAEAMGATYLPLPGADAASLSFAVQGNRAVGS